VHGIAKAIVVPHCDSPVSGGVLGKDSVSGRGLGMLIWAKLCGDVGLPIR
jgi:hypothetical protein